MSATWTQDRVLALAPDAASASAGQGLASARKWSGIGRSARAVWGLCQGSGKDPYQTRVDLSEPAFKCSCPSRKFPCKHGIGLMLLLAKESALFKHADEPGWVKEWIEGRAERAEKKAEKAREPEAPPDPVAQAKRAAQRESRVLAGVAECRTWLEDLVRRGLASAQSEPEAFWERAAARMVDAQAPGLARLIRELPEVIASGEGWPRRTLDRLGRIHLLLRAAERLDALPPALAGDVRVALGHTQAKEEALAGETVDDTWCVAGQITEQQDRLRVRRTWCIGRNTARRALILDFAAGPQPLDTSLIAGTEFDGTLAFYPSSLPLRAVVKDRRSAARAPGPLGQHGGAIEAELTRFAQAVAACPWLERWPALFSSVTPLFHRGAWSVFDGDRRSLPLRPSFEAAWTLLAVSRAQPVQLLGEWDGEFLTPLSAITPAAPHPYTFHDLAPRWAA